MDKIFIPYLEKIEDSLQKALPNNFDSNWNIDSFGILPKAINNIHINNLVLPCRSLMDLGGKRWRPLLQVLCFNLAIESEKTSELSQEDIYNLTPVVEFVHTASLIHDDIEDGADTRRGKPASHITYGLDTALNAASWLYFEASVCINKLNISTELKNKIYNLYTQELRRLHLGQAMDILWHNNPTLIPLPEEYSAMVRNKTGTLSSLATQIGLMAAGCSIEEVQQGGQIASSLGEGFQILDDVINLTKGNPGKKRGDDIVEGKKSLPILIHLQEKPEDIKLISKYMINASKEGINSSSVEECIKLLNTSDCISKATQKGINCINENIKALANIFNTSSKCKTANLLIKLFTDMIPQF